MNRSEYRELESAGSFEDRLALTSSPCDSGDSLHTDRNVSEGDRSTLSSTSRARNYVTVRETTIHLTTGSKPVLPFSKSVSVR